MEYRYAPNKSYSKQGKIRRKGPEKWISGPEPYQHELFYAWHKHRSQARYRKEPYELTFEDWQKFWIKQEDFFARGRQPEDLCITRKDPDLAWSADNCEIVTRLEQLRRAKSWTMRKRHNL